MNPFPPERLSRRQDDFRHLLGRYGVSPADAYPVFDDLVERYSEPHRHYHNLEHVDEVLKVAGRLADLCDDPSAVVLAVWFHDAVYAPTRGDNEERSADLARDRLGRLGLPDGTVAHVVALILSTRHTGAVVVQAVGPDFDALRDADLAVLGAVALRYDRYAAAVRAEYAHVGDEDYRRGRAVVLRHFLGMPRIYRTERMYIEGEERARANLARELTGLEGQT